MQQLLENFLHVAYQYYGNNQPPDPADEYRLHMGIRYVFSKPFQDKLSYEEEDHVLGNSGDLVLYTDSSKIKQGTGIGLYGQFPLGQYATFF